MLNCRLFFCEGDACGIFFFCVPCTGNELSKVTTAALCKKWEGYDVVTQHSAIPTTPNAATMLSHPRIPRCAASSPGRRTPSGARERRRQLYSSESVHFSFSVSKCHKMTGVLAARCTFSSLILRFDVVVVASFRLLLVALSVKSGMLKRSTYAEYAKEAAGVWQVVLIFLSMAVGQVSVTGRVCVSRGTDFRHFSDHTRPPTATMFLSPFPPTVLGCSWQTWRKSKIYRLIQCGGFVSDSSGAHDGGDGVAGEVVSPKRRGAEPRPLRRHPRAPDRVCAGRVAPEIRPRLLQSCQGLKTAISRHCGYSPVLHKSLMNFVRLSRAAKRLRKARTLELQCNCNPRTKDIKKIQTGAWFGMAYWGSIELFSGEVQTRPAAIFGFPFGCHVQCSRRSGSTRGRRRQLSCAVSPESKGTHRVEDLS